MALRYLCMAVLLAACATAWAQSRPAASGPVEPVFVGPGEPVGRALFGDDKDIALLAIAAGDADPLTREQAVRDLGQTHNLPAEPLIRSALTDENVNVRCAAVTAAAELGVGQGQAIVLAALKSSDVPMQRSALAAVRRFKLSAARPQVEAMLGTSPNDVQADSLIVLTEMGFPADAQKLALAMGSSSVALRLRAAQNAALLDSSAGRTVGPVLAEMAANDGSPAVRGAALTALGRFSATQQLLDRSRADKDPLVRRGALEASVQLGKADVIKAFLADPSPMVRLAAIGLAGQQKREECIDELFKILWACQDELSTAAACHSLAQIGTDKVAVPAGQAVGVYLKKVLDYKQQKDAADRKATDATAKAEGLAKEPGGKAAGKKAAGAALKKAQADVIKAAEDSSLLDQQFIDDSMRFRLACRLLGELRSREGLDARVQALTTFDFYSDMQIDVVWSLGQSGDPAVREPLRAMLARTVREAQKLDSHEPPKGVMYKPKVAIACVQAAAALEDVASLPQLTALLAVRANKVSVLQDESVAIMAAVPSLSTPATQSQIATMINEVIGGMLFDSPARFEAIKASARLNLAQCVPMMKRVLTEIRDDRRCMNLAAWAIQKLANQRVEVPPPLRNPGGWIIVQGR